MFQCIEEIGTELYDENTTVCRVPCAELDYTDSDDPFSLKVV